MPLNDNALNAMADHLATLATSASLHSADPGATGINETTAGRQTVTWTGAATGDIAISAQENFTGGGASAACTYVGLWNGAGTVFYGGFALTGDQTFNAAGEYTLETLTLDGSAS